MSIKSEKHLVRGYCYSAQLGLLVEGKKLSSKFGMLKTKKPGISRALKSRGGED
jgi:hypothetical protein